MKKLILLALLLIPAPLCQAQDTMEKIDKNPTGYITAPMPYDFGTIDGVLYVFQGRYPYILVRYPAADRRESYTIPYYVNRISRGAFAGCQYLKELNIPSSVHYIGDNAFEGAEIEVFNVYEEDIAAYAPAVETTVKGQQYYDLSGRHLSNPTPGVNILIDEGQAKKVLVK